MKKRVLSLLLCLCLCLPLLTAAVSAAAIHFADVSAGDYFAEPVAWAVDHEITNGTSATTFSPNATCTRAQILTFLWRAAGSPESVAFLSNPYLDIAEDAYYYQAALWAKEYGMVESVQFSPNTPCTRAATVEYFWKYDGWNFADDVSFSDVSAGTELAEAVSWAVTYGITNGTGKNTFSPETTCTRGQIVTFLYRYFVAPLDSSTLQESAPATETPAAPPADAGKLDPVPPVDYMKQPDWYGILTPAHTMSNARLVAEYEQIEKIIDERRAQDIYMGDAIYSRELDLWSQLSQRCDIVERYDRGLRNDSLSERTIADYEALIAAHGDVEPLRSSSEYAN